MAGQISDSILDSILEQDPMNRVACETLVTTGLAMVVGEITTEAIETMGAADQRQQSSTTSTRRQPCSGSLTSDASKKSSTGCFPSASKGTRITRFGSGKRGKP